MLDSFYLCYFETTRRCNLACAYCMSRPTGHIEGEELDTGECKRLVLDEIRKISSNAAVAFSGGEHLLRPDAYELLEYATSIGLWSFVNTNGRAIVEDDAAERVKEATGGKAIFALPLNSVDPLLNQSSRDDDVATVIDAAAACREAGVAFFFVVTISRGNLGTLAETLSELANRGIPVLRAPFVPRGAGAEFRDLMFDRNDMRDVIHPALTADPFCYISFTPFFTSPEDMRSIWDRAGVRIQGLGCQAGRSFAAVGAEGGIAPCVQLLDSDCVRGNVRDLPLSEVVRQDPVFEMLRDRTSLKGKCGGCRYRDVCGGCRALAFYHSGDIFAEDPTCFFEPSGPGDVSELERLQTKNAETFAGFIKLAEPWKSLF